MQMFGVVLWSRRTGIDPGIALTNVECWNTDELMFMDTVILKR